MTKEEKKKFTVALLALQGIPPGKQFDEIQLGAFCAVVDDLGLEAALLGIRRCLVECKFQPAPAELREKAGGVSPSERAVLEWQVVQRAIGRIGSYETVVFKNPITHAAVQMIGGWVYLCGTSPDQLGFARLHFLQAHEIAHNAGTTAQLLRPMIGLHGNTTPTFIESTLTQPRSIEAVETKRIEGKK